MSCRRLVQRADKVSVAEVKESDADEKSYDADKLDCEAELTFALSAKGNGEAETECAGHKCGCNEGRNSPTDDREDTGLATGRKRTEDEIERGNDGVTEGKEDVCYDSRLIEICVNNSLCLFRADCDNDCRDDRCKGCQSRVDKHGMSPLFM